MKTRSLLLSTAVLAATGAASAQSIDYSRMERLFHEPVTASATGSPQKVSDAPVNMQIIGTDDIRRSGADNIPDILAFVAGLDVRRYGFGHAEVAMRGYNQQFSPRLLVLINGRQVYNDIYGYTVWSTLPVDLADIRQIEVIRGPNSALFGFNAVGGVINIITNDPLLDQSSSVTVRGGTGDHVEANASVTTRIGEIGAIRLSAARQRADGFGDEKTVLTPQNDAVSLDARFKLAPTVEASLEGTASHARYADTINATGALSEKYRTNSVKAGLAAGTGFGLLGLTAYRNEMHQSSGPTSLNNVVYVVQANGQFKPATDHTVRLGLEYRNNSGHSRQFFAGTIGYEVYAASANWNWEVTPSLTMSHSVRLDHLRLTENGALSPANDRYSLADYDGVDLTEPSFNSGLVYRLSADDTLRLTMARGIQAPSLINLGMQATLETDNGRVAFLGSPDLNPASVMNYEVGYDRKLTPIASTLRLSLFYQTNRDLLSNPVNMPVAAGGQTSYAANIGDSNATGGEIALTGTSGNVRWNASYAAIRINDDFVALPGTGEGLGMVRYSNGTPHHKLTLGGGYTLGAFEFDAQARWQSAYTDYVRVGLRSAQPERIDGFLTLNARIGYQVAEAVTLALTGQQLNQAHQTQTPTFPVDRRVYASATVRF